VRTHVVAVMSGPAHSYEEAYSSGGERAGTPKGVPVRVLADTCDLLKCGRHLKKRVGQEESECGLYLNMFCRHARSASALSVFVSSFSLCLSLSLFLSLSLSFSLSITLNLSVLFLSLRHIRTHTIHTHTTHTHKHNTHTHTSDLPATQVDERRNILYSASEDKSVKVWDLTTLKCIETLEGHDDGAVSLQVSLCVCVYARACLCVCVCVCVRPQ
jgi:WD40 repeat protein